jgi:hypothetical protein
MFNIKKEIEFWTRIMRDHGEFQYTSLAPNEYNYIKRARYFMDVFENLHEEARNLPDDISNKDALSLIPKNIVALQQFVDFKREMLTMLVKCNIGLGLTPTFLNHMINEAMEYYRVLCIIQGTIPYNAALENIRLHKVWLPDASGHASAIASDLDAVESEFVYIGDKFSKRFRELFIKSYEMYKIFERTGVENGSLLYLNKEVEKEIDKFITYLESVEVLRESCNLLGSGTLKSLIPNHMIREEQYYMNRIKMLYE